MYLQSMCNKRCKCGLNIINGAVAVHSLLLYSVDADTDIKKKTD